MNDVVTLRDCVRRNRDGAMPFTANQRRIAIVARKADCVEFKMGATDGANERIFE